MVTRRNFLKSVGGAAALGGTYTLCPGLSFARARTNKRLVVVMLRGGMDGLAALVPYGDEDYAATRGELALNPDNLIKITPFFGLHPSLEPLAELYKAGEMIAFPASASPYRERSHFDGQNILEIGATKAYDLSGGWLNRAISHIDKHDDMIGLALGQGLPALMRGDNNVNSWAPSALPDISSNYMDLIQKIYLKDNSFSGNLNKALKVQEMGMDALSGNERNLTRRSRSQQAIVSMAQTAGKWLKKPDGPRIATLELGGWDTHIRQGVEGGSLANNFSLFARGITALKESLGKEWKNTTVLALTEFGRTAHPNGSAGTDHGTAGTTFLFGGNLNGGHVISHWPGLAEQKLYEGRDLMPTIDTRAICKAILNQHYGISYSALNNDVFPKSAGLDKISGIIKI